MKQITLDPAMLAKLGNLHQPAELHDESGHFLGYFTPTLDPSLYQNVDIPFSNEELDQASRQGGGRLLKDIMADLEKLP